ncbi:hypothetical protein [Thermophilibacter sp.]
MRGLLRLALAGGVVAGLSYAAYRTLLTEQARDDLKDGVRGVRDSWDRISDAVGLSPADAEAERVAAQEDARLQWERLGY